METSRWRDNGCHMCGLDLSLGSIKIIVLNHLSPTLEEAGYVIRDLTELGMYVDDVNA